MIRIYLKSVTALAVTVGSAAVALVLSGVEKIGRAQEADELREYHVAACEWTDQMADERLGAVGDLDFDLWASEPCVDEVTYS